MFVNRRIDTQNIVTYLNVQIPLYSGRNTMEVSKVVTFLFVVVVPSSFLSPLSLFHLSSGKFLTYIIA
jgi:hypothetical protein